MPIIYAINARLGLNDIRKELIPLVALPVGYFCGVALNLIVK
jgi:hypothetical protein